MAAKKSFVDALNPALQFISATDQDTIPTPPEGYRLDPRFIEKKTRRLQLLLRPSIYEKLKARADAEGQSVNEFIDHLLEATLKEGR